MRKLATLALTAIIIFQGIITSALPTLAGTDAKKNLEDIGRGIGIVDPASNNLLTLVGTVIKLLLSLLGIVMLLIVLFGGWKWMTAGGESEKVGEAKTMIINATIGLAIIMAAYSIAYFVFDALDTAIKGGSV